MSDEDVSAAVARDGGLALRIVKAGLLRAPRHVLRHVEDGVERVDAGDIVEPSRSTASASNLPASMKMPRTAATPT